MASKSEETLERRLSALICADVAGYSRLMADDEVATVRTLSACRERVSAVVRENGGRLVDFVGDNMLAEIHLYRRQHDEALAASERAILARPSCDTSYVAKAGILNYLGRPAEAIELARFAIRLSPVYPAFYTTVLAAAYFGCGRFEEAVSAAELSLETDPHNLDALLFLTAANAALGLIVQAQEAAQAVLNVKPDFALETFAASQPYKDPHDLEQILERLKLAGL